MCTAISYKTKDFYFGRNLDLDRSFGEGVVVTPRNYPFAFRNGTVLERHYAMIGMATLSGGYPLYFEATNEKGLNLAGLNFPGNAVYYPEAAAKENIAPFELIPYLLGQCANVEEALAKLKDMNLWNTSFSAEFPLSPLHWLMSDRERAVTLEPMADGLKIHENPVGVLANNPPFDFHMFNLANYMNLTSRQAENRFGDVEIKPYCLGMGAIGLPGDLSSPSRLVRAVFMKAHSLCDQTQDASVTQLFHILASVAHVRGSVMVQDKPEITVYSSCCNTTRGIYHYTTYENSQITAIDMHKENLQGDRIVSYPLIRCQQICLQNG